MQEAMHTALVVYGLAIVVSMIIAAVIKVIVIALGALERKPAAAPAAAPTATLDVMGDHVAAIAAAVYASMGAAARIVHIEPTHTGAEWLVEGRMAQHGSHVTHHPAR